MALMRGFGGKLQLLRLAAGLTADGLAEACRLPGQTISSAEAGRVEPALRLILILCDGLGISPDELIGELPAPEERRSQFACGHSSEVS
jgi:transcriptional regulator with XRE-family HTH domain